MTLSGKTPICECGHKQGSHLGNSGRCVWTHRCNCVKYKPTGKESDSKWITIGPLQIRGLAYYEYARWASHLNVGTELALEFAPTSDYSNAIKVLYNGHHIGYVPAETAAIIAPMLKNGVAFTMFVIYHNHDNTVHKTAKWESGRLAGALYMLVKK